MAELVVTFSKVSGGHSYDAPIAQGSAVRTEVLTMPADGELEVLGEQVVELLSDADCWVVIGSGVENADADAASGVARKLKAGFPYTYGVSNGDRVAVAASA